MPGHVWKLGGEAWHLKVTGESFKIMTQWLINKQNMKNEGGRVPITKPQMEDTAQLCALVVSIRTKVLRQYPIKEEVMTQVVEELIRGQDHTLELELQSEMQLKNFEFNAVQHITCIKHLVSSHTAKAAAAVGKQEVHIEAAALDKAQFELLETEMKYDFQVIDVFQRSLRSNIISQYRAKRQWRVEQHQKVSDIVDRLLANKVVCLHADAGYASVSGQIFAEMSKLRGQHNVAEDGVHTLVWANWIATSLIKAQASKLTQTHLLISMFLFLHI